MRFLDCHTTFTDGGKQDSGISINIKISQRLPDWKSKNANAAISSIDITYSSDQPDYYRESKDWRAFEDTLAEMRPTPYVSFDMDMRYQPSGGAQRMAALLAKQDFLPQLVANRKVLVSLPYRREEVVSIFITQNIEYEVDDDVLADVPTAKWRGMAPPKEVVTFYLCHPLKVPLVVHTAIEHVRQFRLWKKFPLLDRSDDNLEMVSTLLILDHGTLTDNVLPSQYSYHRDFWLLSD